MKMIDMKIKTRDMKLTGFMEDTSKRKFFSKLISIGNEKAVVGIIKWYDVLERFEIHYNFKDEIIADNNYTWIQIAPMESNYWIKAMYDENDKLVEVYIDITRSNNFDDVANPYYEDLFLDVVVPRKGHIYQMDDVELMKAYKEGLVPEAEYKKAKVICKKLISYITLHHQEFLDFLLSLKNELENDLKSE